MNPKQTAFKTISGSVYEIDFAKKKIRRLSGKGKHTERQGNDGDWQEYNSVSDINIGKPVLITWGKNVSAFVPGSVPGTMTSIVDEILYEI